MLKLKPQVPWPQHLMTVKVPDVNQIFPGLFWHSCQYNPVSASALMITAFVAQTPKKGKGHIKN